MSASQYEAIISFGGTLILLAGVAAMMKTAMVPAHHSIPWEAKQPLLDRYGKWAVNRAESFCPENDVACVEREARRLVEVTTYRR